jgi:hypothetical protein
LFIFVISTDTDIICDIQHHFHFYLYNEKLSGLFSLKSIVSLSVLTIVVDIGAFLYLTLDADFEAENRMLMRSTGDSESLIQKIPTEEIRHIINAARQGWSIVDKKY